MKIIGKILQIKETLQFQDSIKAGYGIVAGISAICTIIGVSMKDILPFSNTSFTRFLLIIVFGLLVSGIIWLIKSLRYRKAINLIIGNTTVMIEPGDIFLQSGWRVIPVDTKVKTETGPDSISNQSLQGELIKKCGPDCIKKVVEKEAEKAKKAEKAENAEEANANQGEQEFARGTVIKFIHGKEKYLLVVLNEINDANQANSTLREYEMALMKMWQELSCINDRDQIVLPILGSGLTNITDRWNDSGNLLRCMLCTLNTSGANIDNTIKIMVYPKDEKNLPLYEYKDAYMIGDWGRRSSARHNMF